MEYIFISSFHFWDFFTYGRVFWRLGGSQLLIAEGGFELLTTLPPPSKAWPYRNVPPHLVWAVLEIQVRLLSMLVKLSSDCATLPALEDYFTITPFQVAFRVPTSQSEACFSLVMPNFHSRARYWSLVAGSAFVEIICWDCVLQTSLIFLKAIIFMISRFHIQRQFE